MLQFRNNPNGMGYTSHKSIINILAFLSSRINLFSRIYSLMSRSLVHSDKQATTIIKKYNKSDHYESIIIIIRIMQQFFVVLLEDIHFLEGMDTND